MAQHHDVLLDEGLQRAYGDSIRGLVVSHRGERCGVYLFGRRLFDALAIGGGIAWHYARRPG